MPNKFQIFYNLQLTADDKQLLIQYLNIFYAPIKNITNSLKQNVLYDIISSRLTFSSIH